MWTGKRYGVYTPETSNPDGFSARLPTRKDEAEGIIVDLSKTGVRPLNRLKVTCWHGCEAKGLTLSRMFSSDTSNAMPESYVNAGAVGGIFPARLSSVYFRQRFDHFSGMVDSEEVYSATKKLSPVPVLQASGCIGMDLAIPPSMLFPIHQTPNIQKENVVNLKGSVGRRDLLKAVAPLHFRLIAFQG
ncbi:MAG: hypothetical protein MZV70_77565 [Desulfobacterales bacterium]|nr:hypothetical protein [Desulfobacterales bacterium]